MFRSHVLMWLVCGVLAAMPALCLAQGTSASTTADDPPNAQSGFNPFGAIRNFFERILPAQRPPLQEPAHAPAVPSTTASPAAPAAAATPPSAATDSNAAAALAAAATPITPAAPLAVIAPVTDHPAQPVAEPVTQQGSQQAAQPATPAAPPAAHHDVALILPSRAPGFSRAAEVTRAGFMAARAAAADKLDVTMIETDGSAENARGAYREGAVRARVVVGPLTRAEVGALTGEIMTVPTLVLNLPEAPANAPLTAPRLPKHMSALALNIEIEAQSAARAVYSTGTRTAVVVTTGSALQKRAAAAFTEAWIDLGGNLGETVEFAGSFARVRQGVDKARSEIVFLAADAQSARLLRPYLGRNTTVIATSQVYAGAPKSEAQKFHDMNGIRFIDMPWLHQSERSAAHGIARPEAPLPADLERLYALGIDAYRIAQELARGRVDFDLDGVTGKLHVHAGQIEREPIEAEYRDGEAVALQ